MTVARVDRGRETTLALFKHFAHAATDHSVKFRTRRTGSASGSGVDPSAVGRAAAASAEVHGRYAGLINAVMQDRSLTPAQRAGVIASLRAKAKAEAKEVSRRIMQAAKGAAKARTPDEPGLG